MKLLIENSLYIYTLFLVLMSGLFLGSEIRIIQHDAEIRSANSKLQNCNVIVAKGTYEQN